MDWNEYFYYDETSPTLLRWKVKVGRVDKGFVAGYKNNGGYFVLQLKSKCYLIHRILYEMFVGPIKAGYEIDHIDGNPSNNSLDNLRMTTHKINLRNMKMSKANKSSVKGVHLKETYNKSGKKFQYWVSCYVDLEGNKRKTTYSVLKLGFENARNMAIEDRQKQIELLNKQGAGYSERHINNDI